MEGLKVKIPKDVWIRLQWWDPRPSSIKVSFFNGRVGLLMGMKQKVRQTTYMYIKETEEDTQHNLWDQCDGELNQDGVRLCPLSKCSRVMGIYMVGLEEDTSAGLKSILKKAGYWLYKSIVVSVVYGRLPRKLSTESRKHYMLELSKHVLEAIPYLLIIGFDKQHVVSNTMSNEKKGTTYFTRGSSKTQNTSSFERDIQSLSDHALSSSPHLYYMTCTSEDLVVWMEEVYEYREHHIDTIHELSSIDTIPLIHEPNLHFYSLERHHMEILTGSGSELLTERLTSSGFEIHQDDWNNDENAEGTSSLPLPLVVDRDERLKKIDWKKLMLLNLLDHLDQDIGNYEREVMETDGIKAVVNLCQSKGVETICQELYRMYEEDSLKH